MKKSIKRSTKVDEGFGDFMKGLGSSLVDKFTKGATAAQKGYLSAKDQYVQQRWLQDLISRATADLQHGIESGIIQPPGAAPKAPPQAAPQAAPAAAPAAEPAAPQAAPQAQSVDMSQLKQQRIAQGQASQQQAIDQMKQTSAANAAAAAKDNANVAAVRAEKQKPGFQQDKGMINRAAARGIHESRFDRLNAIFESIMSLDEEEEYSYTISSYLQAFLKKYLSGINVAPLKKFADQVEATYNQDKGAAALQKMASAAYSLYWTGGAGAAGETATSGGGGAGETATSGGGAAGGADQITKMIPSMSKEQLTSLKAAIDSALGSGSAAPGGQAVDVSQVKQQSQAQGQASQQQAIDQMKQTAATNAATSAADTQLAAQVKAEKQKPEFQQDKGMLRRAAARGINESKKENSKKVRVWGKK